MAYDSGLADRIRDTLSSRGAIEEKKMFGGIAFLLDGNMAVGVNGDDMIVRVSPGDHEKLIKEKGARTFDMTGRPMTGWLLVGAAALKNAAALTKWISRGVDYASSLPPKTSGARKAGPARRKR